ncbi:SigE family RNA polymerase sigma factor [Nocardioides hankookensis]|uniref:SigE family RNA polymerase sigma factor n=1 Tax=Nocardioides hankookensis TaxID=443157 RepID=A0ABW1LH95_9ACTN
MRRVSGRDEAFTSYVSQRHRHLLRTAYLLCGDLHLAEDLVQNTLVKLYMAWPRAARADNVDAYVRRVLVNAHLDETRRPWRRERVVSDSTLGASAPAHDLAGRDELTRALRELPERQRAVVVLRHYWGLSIRETAEDLKISTGTVKSQTAKALTSLAHSLQACEQ